MIDNGDSGRRSLLAYDDPRSAEQRYKDRRRVAQQVEAIRANRANEAYRRELLRLAMQRRMQRAVDVDDQPVVDFDVLPERGGRDERDARGPRDLLLAVAEILVRTEDAAAAKAALQGDYDAIPDPELDNRVTRLVPKPGGGRRPQHLAQVAQDAEFLRGLGIMATVTHVVPLGYVAKGRGGAEPTELVTAYQHHPPRATGNAVQVAVIDTGITAEVRDDGWLADVDRGNPPDRDPAVIDPLHWFSADGKTLDLAAGHGTLAAGVVQQVAPDAAIRMYRSLDSDGIGDERRIARTLVRAVRDGAQVVNLSLGTQTEGDHPPVALEVALELVAEIAPDALVVAAAGNSGSSRPTWPAAFPDVVAVAGLTSDLTPGVWSNRGHWVDCSTTGEGVVSTFVQGVELPEVDDPPDEFGLQAWAVVTGTSFAAPQVVGAVARLLHENPTGEADLTPRKALRLLLAPDRGQEHYFGARRLPDFGWAVPLLPGT